MQVFVQFPAIFEAATEIGDHMGTILAHAWYGKGSKKPKSKGKNPYYIPYHHDNMAGGDAGPVPMELGKITLKFWTCGGPNYYYYQCPNYIGSFSGVHQTKKNKN